DKDSGSRGDDHGDRSDSGKYGKPEGGVHAGGGALAKVTSDDWQKDESGSGNNADRDKPESWKHEKPEGGVHAGGGAMALSGGGLAAGSVLMLGGIGAAAYRLRRRNASGTAAA
ncbi:hypothetical protein GTW44_00835, partial [Streptomyces sp. SID8360]